MAKGNYGWGNDGYSTTSSGTNSQVRASTSALPSDDADPYILQGNHYCHRDGGSDSGGSSGSSGYHYSNS
ncbi:uncharacterized protein PHACADRAFT_252972 [Phanerochaete carnosa HHB-10118-sp]|uniref:Uncharacterized protein n=1 Tax=Phanerochaete carnosa (strain HHB-10118-sp) TaxID=650164 RepID=K5WHG0_PHACS|nr:uncharacterized protein PHACADRAFT_252972 [Phanerochaete carnosa HHB-10118-sp]EKM58549.1 hypothetical protein PHACADRAFT_252972 [Phanerochaete carnosa HHB-10118-sp]